MKKPNVLFIIMDDQRADTLGIVNNPHIQTPNLDEIASNGTVFTNTFLTVPICTPGRAEVLTGCNSFANHVMWFGIPINPELKLLPQTFNEAGYHCSFVGKWHNDGHPRDKGFHRTRRCMGQDRVGPNLGHDMTFEEDGELVRGHSTELFTDAALEEITRSNGDKPWFTYLAYHSPHDPFDCPEPYQSMYDTPDFPLPENYCPEHAFDNGDMTIRDELLLPFPRTQEAIRTYRARYYGMITHHDYHIGRIIDHLKKTGEYENTVIVFTGDHGLAVGSHGFLGKENMYDHSTRIPFMIQGPGIEPGKRVGDLCCNTDIYPTLCELTGISVPETVRHGQSLAPYLDGSPPEPMRDSVFSAFRSPLNAAFYEFVGVDPQVDGLPHPRREGQFLHETQRMVRTKTHKLAYYPRLSRFQLFDLEQDPHEMHDLLQAWRMVLQEKPWRFEPTHPTDHVLTTANALKERMLQHMEENDDPLLAKLTSTDIAEAVTAPYRDRLN